MSNVQFPIEIREKTICHGWQASLHVLSCSVGVNSLGSQKRHARIPPLALNSFDLVELFQ